MRMDCPHCGERAVTRTSKRPSPALYEVYLRCMNEQCGWAGKAFVEFAKTTCPSAQPRPGLEIPLDSTWRKILQKRLEHEG